MAKAETNQAKRAVMQQLMAAVFARGWTPALLAAYTDHTSSCISSWKLGKSMGTNAQRAELAKLPEVSDPTVLYIMEARLEAAQAEARGYAAKLDEARSPAYLAAKRAEAVKHHTEMVTYYTTTAPERLSGNGKWPCESDAQYQRRVAEALADAKECAAEESAQLADAAGLDAEAAQDVANSVRWNEKQLRIATERAETIERAIASYVKGRK